MRLYTSEENTLVLRMVQLPRPVTARCVIMYNPAGRKWCGTDYDRDRG